MIRLHYSGQKMAKSIEDFILWTNRIKRFFLFALERNVFSVVRCMRKDGKRHQWSQPFTKYAAVNKYSTSIETCTNRIYCILCTNTIVIIVRLTKICSKIKRGGNRDEWMDVCVETRQNEMVKKKHTNQRLHTTTSRRRHRQCRAPTTTETTDNRCRRRRRRPTSLNSSERQ